MSRVSSPIRWRERVTSHYDRYPYPHYPLLASVPLHDTYALSLTPLYGALNGTLPPAEQRILLAGCGAFAPYPVALANPGARIDAIDLSRSNLRRARLHTLLHGIGTIRFLEGDFLQDDRLTRYHFIDAFGVLHHLEEPLDGFRRLASLLEPGGILRVMVYGRYARQEAESIRRAMRLLRIDDARMVRRLLSRAPAGSRVREYLDASWEARTLSGIADLFLHPSVTTYRMVEFMELVTAAGLVPLRFAHTGALPDPGEEIERFRELDRQRASRTNIICYLGREGDLRRPEVVTHVTLNPSLRRAVSPLTLRTVTPMNRLGIDTPPITGELRRFLRRFRSPLPLSSLSTDEGEMVRRLVTLWYLVPFRPTKGDDDV